MAGQDNGRDIKKAISGFYNGMNNAGIAVNDNSNNNVNDVVIGKPRFDKHGNFII